MERKKYVDSLKLSTLGLGTQEVNTINLVIHNFIQVRGKLNLKKGPNTDI